MWVGVLGPLCVRDGDVTVPVSAAKQRALLAALLVRANYVVSFDELAETVWEGAPAPGARTTVRNYVRRLRQALGPAIGSRIVTHHPGYVFEAGEKELDLLRFAGLCRDGGAAMRAGDWQRACAALDEALALWRGTPLTDVPSQRLQRDEVPPLVQARLQALEWRHEASLHLGRPAEVAAELERLSLEHPLRERLHAQLMLALYRCGRQADALAVYARARAALVGELGVEPGPELRQLHHRILRADPGLLTADAAEPGAGPGAAERAGTSEPGSTSGPAGTPERAGAGTGPGDRAAPAAGRQAGRPASDPVTPRQLPAGTAHFVGRAGELAELTRLLGQDGGAHPIAVIGGAPGVGKTALAVHWAHQAAGYFTDGQLYVDLRGFDPAGPPLATAQAVRGFLDALGVPAARIPAGTQEQAGLYRSLLAGRRMLVVLDNARDEQQVRPLLPGDPECLAVITSRGPLAGLVAAHSARHLTLDVLAQDEAHELLACRLGRGRVAAEPEAVSEVIGHCARLPLALAIAAASAVTSPRRPLSGLAQELRESPGRLDALDLADDAMSVRGVFACSYHALSGEAARMFRLLGIGPGPDISVTAAASLAYRGRGQARSLLRELTRACLLTEPSPGRFTCHDLLRAYAAELARGIDAETGCRAALHRLLDHYLHNAVGAALCLNPKRWPISVAPAQPGTERETFTGEADALAWLETERPALLAAITRAGEARFDTHAWQLPWALAEFFVRQGRWQEWLAAQRTAVTAAQRSGDRAGHAISLRFLGRATTSAGDYDRARAHLLQALDLSREVGDQVGQALVHVDLCHICLLQGHKAAALSHAQQSLEVARAVGLRRYRAVALNALGWCHAQTGNPQQALAYCAEALALHRDVGNSYGEACTLDSIGFARHLLGQHAEAIRSFGQALDGHAMLGDRRSQAETLSHLGDAHAAMGSPAAAAAAWREALEIMADLQRPEFATLSDKLQKLVSATAATAESRELCHE